MFKNIRNISWQWWVIIVVGVLFGKDAALAVIGPIVNTAGALIPAV